MSKIIKLLEKHGPMLSGELERIYAKEYNTSNDAARKAVSRARSPVQRVMTFKFDKNQVFCHLEKQYMSTKYMDALLEAIRKHSKVNHTVLQTFIDQGGYVSKKILPSFTSSPVEKVQSHKMCDKIIKGLLDSNLIIEYDETTYMLNPDFGMSGKRPHSLGIEIAKKNIISNFDNWAKKINLVAYNSGQTLFENPVFAHFRWAYTAPSYIQPMYSYNLQRPGFVVADVFFGKMADIHNIQFFIDKLGIIRSFKNLPSFMPILFVESITSEALDKLKELKVVVAILKNVFSEKYVELLKDLVTVFENATAIMNKQPEQIYKLFDNLAQNEGKYNNMAGDMFELLVGSHYSYIGCSYLRSKQLIKTQEGKRKELDLLIKKDGRTIVVECKATKSPIDEEFVSKWLNDNIPVTRKWLKEKFDTDNVEFQLWSIGGFTDEASRLLLEAQESVRKYKIEYFTRAQMLDIAWERKDTNFIEIINTHFNYTFPS